MEGIQATSPLWCVEYVRRCVEYVRHFAEYMQNLLDGKSIDEVSEEDVKTYVDWIEGKPHASTKLHLWALRYYFAFTSNTTLYALTNQLRQQRIKLQPFKIKNFVGVQSDYAEKLAAIGINNTEQMLTAGRTRDDRRQVAETTGVPQAAILEFVKLSDLARIGAVRAKRARLYYDAGIDTPEKLAHWNPENLRQYLIGFIQRTGFKGIAPQPNEARYTVRQAQNLQNIVEY